jgi:hypothetical protein
MIGQNFAHSQFSRHPFRVGSEENRFKDEIRREPLKITEEPVPVATIRRTYSVIQHGDVLASVFSDHRPRFDPSHESPQGPVSQLAIPCADRDVYYTRHRCEWLAKVPQAGVRRSSRATLPATGHAARRASASPASTARESRKHAITAKLPKIPSLGPFAWL